VTLIPLSYLQADPFPAGQRHPNPVARILIVEPHGDIRSLLEIVITRLGHKPVVHDGVDQELDSVDAAVIEPGEGLALAQRLRAHGLPVIFTSIFPPSPEALELEPMAYLVKPFALYTLENALTAALELATV
jgi:DNA-binding response OmpR family regulator